jgi:hypothetical protein
MRSRKYRFPLVVLLTLLVANASAGEPRHVTFSELVASPRQFDGRRVSVTGYYAADIEGSDLFANAAAAKTGLGDFIWVEFRRDARITSIANGPARLVGTFHYNPEGSKHHAGYGTWGISSMALLDTTSFETLK